MLVRNSVNSLPLLPILGEGSRFRADSQGIVHQNGQLCRLTRGRRRLLPHLHQIWNNRSLSTCKMGEKQNGALGEVECR